MKVISMRKVQITVLPFVALLSIAGATLVAGCGSEGGKTPAAGTTVKAEDKHGEGKAASGKGEAEGEHADEKLLKLSAKEMESAGIKAIELRTEALNEKITVTATIQANQDRLAKVSPRVSGKIVSVSASLGDRVKAGQTLAMIDSIDVGEAQSSHAQAQSEYQLAQKNLQRSEKLQAEQIIPEKDYLRSQAETQKARAVLLATTQKLQALGVSPVANHAGPGVSVFPLTAPFAGVVIDKKAVLGELSQPDKPLFTVADLSNVWIEANVFEMDLGKVKVGADAEITVAAYPNEAFKGRVRYVGNTMDRETRTARALIEVPNRDGRLRLDMFANAAIGTDSAVEGLQLPDDAVMLIQGQPTVFVAEADGFQTRAVELGDKLRGRVLIKSGIKPGERVVVAGAYALKAKLLKSQIGDAH